MPSPVIHDDVAPAPGDPWHGWGETTRLDCIERSVVPKLCHALTEKGVEDPVGRSSGLDRRMDDRTQLRARRKCRPVRGVEARELARRPKAAEACVPGVHHLAHRTGCRRIVGRKRDRYRGAHRAKDVVHRRQLGHRCGHGSLRSRRNGGLAHWASLTEASARSRCAWGLRASRSGPVPAVLAPVGPKPTRRPRPASPVRSMPWPGPRRSSGGAGDVRRTPVAGWSSTIANCPSIQPAHSALACGIRQMMFSSLPMDQHQAVRNGTAPSAHAPESVYGFCSRVDRLIWRSPPNLLGDT